jgi:hypothetical protein
VQPVFAPAVPLVCFACERLASEILETALPSARFALLERPSPVHSSLPLNYCVEANLSVLNATREAGRCVLHELPGAQRMPPSGPLGDAHRLAAVRLWSRDKVAPTTRRWLYGRKRGGEQLCLQEEEVRYDVDGGEASSWTAKGDRTEISLERV